MDLYHCLKTLINELLKEINVRRSNICQLIKQKMIFVYSSAPKYFRFFFLISNKFYNAFILQDCSLTSKFLDKISQCFSVTEKFWKERRLSYRKKFRIFWLPVLPVLSYQLHSFIQILEQAKYIHIIFFTITSLAEFFNPIGSANDLFLFLLGLDCDLCSDGNKGHIRPLFNACYQPVWALSGVLERT